MADRILGTAGHIDHGKTALVHALTGVDTDRLPEEKARGISIALGFASLTAPDGSTLGVVDVPGHEAFVRTMVAGATGFDLVLLCVAADEGVMPQTREHLAVLELLAVPRLVVALTRCDRAEEGMAELVEEEVREVLEPSRYAASPMVRVSAVTGEGVDALRALLLEVAGTLGEPPDPEDLTLLPVDRAFTVHGTGTVVTGTLRSGRIRRGDELTLHPGAHAMRVRGLQRHGAEVAEVRAGTRTAVALVGRGGGGNSVGRGWALSGGSGWREATTILARVTPVDGHERAVSPGTRVRILIGTGEVLGTLRRVRGCKARRIDLEGPVVVRGGERFVIRSLTPVETVAGGLVLHPFPPRRLSGEEGQSLLEAFMHESPAERVVLAVAGAGFAGIPLEEVPVRLGIPGRDSLPAGITVVDGCLFEEGWIRRLVLDLESAVDEFHRANPEQEGILPAELTSGGSPGSAPEPLVIALVDSLVRDKVLAWTHGRLHRPDHLPNLPEHLQPLAGRIAELLVAAGFKGKEEGEVAAAVDGKTGECLTLLHFLERGGLVANVGEGRWVHAGRLEEARRRLEATFAPGESISPADARECLGLSRRLLLPLMERWDREGFTERVGDKRTIRRRPSTEGSDDSP